MTPEQEQNNKMRTKNAVGIVFAGSLALAAMRGISLDQKVRDAAKDLLKPPRIEETAKGISGEKSQYTSTTENPALNGYISMKVVNAMPPFRNEDPSYVGQTARLSLYVHPASEIKAMVLYEDNIAIRVWNKTIAPDGEFTKYFEVKREKGEHTY